MSPFLPFEHIKAFTEESLTFNKLLGIQVIRAAQGEARLEVPFRPDLLGDPRRGALHGGLVATLLDTCGGTAILSLFQNVDDHFSTVDMRIDYLRPGQHQLLAAEAKVLRAGKRLSVVDIVAFHPGSEHEPVATGRALYSLRVTQKR
ncbi:PaaI family thioesterase [Stigmatella erecta]|uniref:Uncharacterized domain 1-containing protein n=1 Tax=Stigmatella erecta TaxID=83460 RepID=A0A1I0L7W8_9BACT|nr:PaaI family thioesterase [Stigmatella erecta]SEU35760.1 uncharacterized domain 1-containing protein [Stigmatella erecta]